MAESYFFMIPTSIKKIKKLFQKNCQSSFNVAFSLKFAILRHWQLFDLAFRQTLMLVLDVVSSQLHSECVSASLAADTPLAPISW